ncbi:hypothetical protein ACFX15_042998 [Malus domestica]
MAAVQGNKNAVAVQWLCSGSGKQQRRRTSITTVKRLAGHEASIVALCPWQTAMAKNFNNRRQTTGGS